MSPSNAILIQAANEYKGPLDAPASFLPKYGHSRHGGESKSSFWTLSLATKGTVLRHLHIDPSKPVPYYSSRVGKRPCFKTIPSPLCIWMYVPMVLHLKPG